jgi:hypothetical protein
MNCQITQIEKDFLKFQIVSSKIDNSYCLLSVVQIDHIDYLLKNQKVEQKSFAEIIEQGQDYIKVRLLRPQKFLLGKIVKVNLVKSDSAFIPNILNSKITFGEKTGHNLEHTFEFIPTVQVAQQVVQGQKIGYINVNTTSKYNFKHWILAQESGKMNKISLGDFKMGELIATIGKNNQLLGNQKDQQPPGAVLLNFKNKNKSLALTSKDQENFYVKSKHLGTGITNLIIDIKKQFLNSINLSQGQFENTVLIFITNDPTFLAPVDFQTITFADKDFLGQSMSKDINDLALNICEIGYHVVIISQNQINVNHGQYKTINGEEVSITIIIQDTDHKHNLDYFDNVITLD